MKTLLNPYRPLSALTLAGLLLTSAADLRAQDADLIVVIKKQGYLQVDPNIVSLVEEPIPGSDLVAFGFGVFAEAPGAGLLTSGFVTPPGGSAIPLLVDPEELYFDQSFEYLAELDDAYGDGTYDVTTVGINDGSQTIMLDLSGDTYPDIPRFTNYTAAQAIDASVNFTLQWNPPANGLATDFAFICIDDLSGTPIHFSPDPGETGALDGTSNSFLIPAGKLAAGQEYIAHLEIAKPVDSDSSYTTALSAYGKDLILPIRTIAPSDATAPQFDRSVPFAFQADVPLNSSVVFCFNEAMDTTVNAAQAITWTGVSNPALFSYHWTDDGRNLLCSYDPAGSGLPASTQVGWTLNPAGSSAKLQDAAGNDLPGEPSGDFSTSATSNMGDPDVEVFEIFKGKAFFQESTTAIDTGVFFGGIFADLTGIGTVRQLDLTIPGGGTVAVSYEPWFDGFDDEALFGGQDDLDTILPNGSYTVDIDTFHDGMKSITLDLTPDSYPNGPEVQNFVAAQAIDSTMPFTLQWNSMTGGTTADIIFLCVESESGTVFFETPESGTEALDGTATQFTIPANTLPPGRFLLAELLFAKIVDVDTTAYPGVTGRAGFLSATCFDLQTIGQPIDPELEVLGFADSQVQIRLHGELGRLYNIRYSGTLQPPWIPYFSVQPFDNVNGFRASFDFSDFSPPGLKARFYQVEEAVSGP